MSRIFFVPQLPVPMRYQEWWLPQIRNMLAKEFDEVVVVGEQYIQDCMHSINDHKDFSPFETAIEFETMQTFEFLNFDIQDSDLLLLADLSFPGFFTSVLYHKKVKNAFAICHGTSVNNYDYFQPVRTSKWGVERAHGRLFKKVFVATHYHKNKLLRKGWGGDNLDVVGFPSPPYLCGDKYSKRYKISSVARPCLQKVNKKLETKVEKEIGTKIQRSYDTLKENMNWDTYYQFLSDSKVLLITSKEETYGYQVIDALINGCIPIAPNNFSYPELLPQEYLYNSHDECVKKIRYFLEYYQVKPSSYALKNAELFYHRLISEMKTPLEME